MRTKHVFMAMATLAIAGCSQNEITEMNPDAGRGIGFGVYTGVQTKGTETTTSGLEGNGVGFGVVALNAGKSSVHMTERHVTKAASGWEYQDIAFWPADGTNLNFYAFAPYNGAGITHGNATFETIAPTIGFAIQDTWGSMVDLVAATKEDVTPTAQAVSMQFNHVLTRIDFTAKTSVALATGTTVAVTGLKFQGSSSNASSKFYASGDYNILSGVWSNEAANTADYDVALTGGSVNVTDSPVALLGANNYLFCIPVASLAANEIKVDITYVLTSNGVTSTKTQTVAITAGHFAKGTAYTYAINITMQGITFTVDQTITGWGTGGSSDIPLS